MMSITDLAERRTRLFADAAAEAITLDDERELHSAFLTAALAGDQERCRVMVEDAESRFGAARAARRLEEQKNLPEYQIARMREEFEQGLQSASPSFQPIISSFREEFAEAEAAQDVVRCRALAAVARDSWNFRTASEIEAQRQADVQAHKSKVVRVQQDRARAAHIAELRQRCAQGWDLLGEIEKHGTARLGEDGAVLYSGQPLDDDLLWALDYRAEHVRNALRQRWQDRVLIPAPPA